MRILYGRANFPSQSIILDYGHCGLLLDILLNIYSSYSTYHILDAGTVASVQMAAHQHTKFVY